jgi:hypothetical protein
VTPVIKGTGDMSNSISASGSVGRRGPTQFKGRINDDMQSAQALTHSSGNFCATKMIFLSVRAAPTNSNIESKGKREKNIDAVH